MLPRAFTPQRLSSLAIGAWVGGLLASACLLVCAPAAEAKDPTFLERLNQREERRRQQEDKQRRGIHPEKEDPVAWMVGLGLFVAGTVAFAFWKLMAKEQAEKGFWASLAEDPQWQRLQVQAFVRQAHGALCKAVNASSGQEAILAPYFSPHLVASWAPCWGNPELKALKALPSTEGLYFHAGHRAERPQDGEVIAVICRPMPGKLVDPDAQEDPERSHWTLKPRPGGVGWVITQMRMGTPLSEGSWRNEG